MGWATPLWANGKVCFTTDDSDVWIFAHGRDKKWVRKFEMEIPIRATPVFANGVLHVMTERTLFAIREKK